MVQLNRLAHGLLAGVLVGLLMGIGARVSMRVVALIGGMHPEFTFGGTVAILVLFAIIGIPFGVIFAGLRPLIPLPAQTWGGLYGLAWAVLASIPFLNDPGGELALASPWVGVALFATLPLCGGLLLGILAPWLERRSAGERPRAIHVAWLVGLLIAVVLAFMGMGSLVDPSARMPRAVWELYKNLGIAFTEVDDVNGMFGVFLVMGYVGGLVILFFNGGQARPARLAVLALLLFAAGFFSQRGIFTGMMDSLRIAALAAGVVKAVGASGLVFLLHTFPDGRFAWPWSRFLVVATALGSLIWFTLPVSGVLPSTWIPQPLQLLAVTVILGSGVVALALRFQRADALLRRQIGGPSVGLAAAVLWFPGLWTAMFFSPDLGFGSSAAPFAPLSVAIYLLPWLLPPLTMIHAMLRRGLWRVVQWESQIGPSIAKNK
jgi:hypothetical protein